MRCVLIGLLLAMPSAHRGQEGKPRTPGEEYQAIVKECQDADRAFLTAYESAKTADQRRTVSTQEPGIDIYAARFLELAQKYPGDPVACDALVKAQVAVVVKNADDPLHQRHLRSWGAPYVASLAACDSQALRKQAEQYFETVIREYGDLTAVTGNTLLADLARSALNELRNLEEDKLAPDIEGRDIDAHPFKLSDYRGKVLLLTFYGDWCGPCKALYPLERAQVARLKDKPFVMLSVVTDRDSETVRKSIGSGEITWKCWWDTSPTGPICKAWNVRNFPTVYVIDGHGIIRYKDPAIAGLTNALDTLMREMETPVKP